MSQYYGMYNEYVKQAYQTDGTWAACGPSAFFWWSATLFVTAAQRKQFKMKRFCLACSVYSTLYPKFCHTWRPFGMNSYTWNSNGEDIFYDRKFTGKNRNFHLTNLRAVLLAEFLPQRILKRVCRKGCQKSHLFKSDDCIIDSLLTDMKICHTTLKFVVYSATMRWELFTAC